MTSEFKKAINSNKFIVTCELAPPKGDDFSQLIENAKPLKGIVDAINITDGQGGNMRMSSVIASHLIQRDAEVEAICQLVCRDRNRIGLQSDILGASALRLKNYLALSGDKAKYGDHPNAQDVFDLGTDDLLKAFGNFSKGIDLNENKINAVIDDFCVGAAAHPNVPSLEEQARKMKAREVLGVSFFQTQIVYETDQLKRFLDSIGEIKVPVLIGITPLKSVKMANFMNEKVYGVSVPQNLIERLEKSDDPQTEGIEISLELIQKVKELGGRGIHIMAINQEKRLKEIINRI
ncbi:MAG: methylenetetrahydrofolate reductase [Candidatus Caenarcaniphilales bacterium]|nr:methylenetetrahydrofolate reductase [Candidatus Caenarcaniphilales bacterium]